MNYKKQQNLSSCISCRQPAVLGKRRCSYHLKKRNEWSNLNYEYKKLMSICTRCDERAEPNRIKCKKHIEENKILNKKQYASKIQKRINEKRCVTCGYKLHDDMDFGKKNCLTCREKKKI